MYVFFSLLFDIQKEMKNIKNIMKKDKSLVLWFREREVLLGETILFLFFLKYIGHIQTRKRSKCWWRGGISYGYTKEREGGLIFFLADWACFSARTTRFMRVFCLKGSSLNILLICILSRCVDLELVRIRHGGRRAREIICVKPYFIRTVCIILSIIR